MTTLIHLIFSLPFHFCILSRIPHPLLVPIYVPGLRPRQLFDQLLLHDLCYCIPYPEPPHRTLNILNPVFISDQLCSLSVIQFYGTVITFPCWEVLGRGSFVACIAVACMVWYELPVPVGGIGLSDGTV
jgi:hypothetical protein